MFLLQWLHFLTRSPWCSNSMSLSKSWFRYACLALLILLLALPRLTSDLTRYLLVDWIKQQGVERVEIEHLWINPYAGVVEVEQVTFYGSEQVHSFERIYLNVNWWDLWSKKIRVTELALSGLSLQLIDVGTQRLINGMVIPSVEDVERPENNHSETIGRFATWHFAIDQFYLEDVRVQVQRPKFSFHANVESLSITPVDTEVHETSKIELTATLENLILNEHQLNASTRLSYSADIELEKSNSGLFSSLQKGKIVVEETKVSNPVFVARLSRLDLGFDHQFELSKGLNFTIDLDSKLSGFSLAQVNQKQNIVEIQDLSFQSKVNRNSLELSEVYLSSLSVLPSLREGFTHANEISSPASFIDKVNLSLNRLRVVLPGKSKAMTVNAGTVELVSGDIYLTRSASGDISQIFRLNEVLSSAAQFFEGAPKDESRLISKTTETANASHLDREALMQSSLSASRVDLSVSQVQVNSGVTIHFVDKSVAPTFSERLVVDHITANNLTLIDPFAIVMKLDLSHGSSVSANADVSMVDLSAKGQLSVNSYELLAVSAYSEGLTGYVLESGKVQLISDFSLAKNQLVSLHKIDIDHLNLRAEHQDSVVQFAHRLTMPLDKAVDLLRDGNDHIHLEVRVNGDMNNPDIDFQQVINTALKGAIKKASIAVLKSFLQPYGTMISIAKIAGEEMTKVRLAPVLFQPGQSELEPSSRSYVEKIGSLIRKRPSLKIKLCALTNARDRTELSGELVREGVDAIVVSDASVKEEEQSVALVLSTLEREKLQALGHERSLVVKNYLQNDLAVSSSQLLMCLPKHKPDQAAGVGLSI